MKVAKKEVSIENKEYVVTLTPIETNHSGRSFKGIQVDMNLPNGEHFARDRFPVTMAPDAIQNWLRNMHYADQTIHNVLEEFEQWDGDLNPIF
ncbi:hypothetical protein [Listeria monocytogenes]|uniref:Uncharacterized protein n=1 Tax=Listeria monocytogenes TaxID=1639 RepID=A0A6C8MXY3_LISMN|nr:hypothetical protein [Listeria monocytogenes]KAA9534092.1 hypothetical protein DCK33_08095 [Listeria monocytogenes]KAA9541483.1 hypothetical protein DCK32_10370 [Listeria monocytogenes]HAB7745300.1 hypothetical protein [Listeria monocytogenes]